MADHNNRHARRVSQKIKPQVQRFEGYRDASVSTRDFAETRHFTPAAARESSSSDSLRLAEVDFSVELTPEISKEWDEGNAEEIPGWVQEHLAEGQRILKALSDRNITAPDTIDREVPSEVRREETRGIPDRARDQDRTKESRGPEQISQQLDTPQQIDKTKSTAPETDRQRGRNDSIQTVIHNPRQTESAPERSRPPARASENPDRPGKHHCLLHGHIFDFIRISDLRPRDRICDLPPPSQRTIHRRKDLKITCNGCQIQVQDEIYQCQIQACKMEVCKRCCKRLEKQRLEKAKGSWKKSGGQL